MLKPKQWIGLTIVAVLAAATVIFVHLVPQRPLPPLAATDTLAPASQRYEKDTLRRHTKHYNTKHSSPQYQHPQLPPLRPRRFNPNTADSILLLEQGLKTWQVSNMLKYRRAGGRWRRRSDMKRLYGLSEEQYRQLRPYIDLPDTLPGDTARRDTLPRYVSHKRDTILELNTADTAQLQLLRGIGRWTAMQIVRYREQLGGYYSVEQLREIPHIDQQMLDTVLQRFTLDTTRITPLLVNRCAVGTLSHHPYLRFEQARAIYEHRRQHIRLSGLDDLRSLPELTQDDLLRLRPYLSFEK